VSVSPGLYVSSPIKAKSGYFERRDVEMRVSTARSVSVTRSTAGDILSVWLARCRQWAEQTVLLRARRRGAGLCRCDARTGLFGDGDHEVMNLAEIEVCHCEVNT
jgi:hypothetical protein